MDRKLGVVPSLVSDVELQGLGGVLHASLSDPDGDGWALQQVSVRD